MKTYTDRVVVSMATVLVVLGLSSCNAGANIGSPQRPVFASAPGSPIAVPGGPGNVLVGDMNNDGKPDLVVASGQSRTISVLLGNGSQNGGGQFPVAPASTIMVPDSPGDMVLGDVNSDSNLDLAIDSHDSYGVVLMLGDGKGGLALAPNSPIVMKEGQHPHTHGLAMGDLNGDGKLDLVTVNNADNDVSVAFGDGRGGFTRAPSSPFAVGPSPYPLALGDLNNDGRLDIVATTTATGPLRAQQLPFSRALTLLLNDGRGGFRSSQLPLLTGQPWFVVIGDVNGDRNPDLLATHHEQNELTVLLGDGQGGFTEVGGSPFDIGHNAFHMVLADVNRDSKIDAIAAVGEGVRIMLGNGHGTFKPSPQPVRTGRGTWRLAVGDVNRDGKVDVFTSSPESNTVNVLLGQ